MWGKKPLKQIVFFVCKKMGYIQTLQGGPLPVISRVIAPVIWGYNPGYPFIMPFIGVITPFTIDRGAPWKQPMA